MLGEDLMSSVDNLVIKHGSTTTDETNWENHNSRELTLPVYSLPHVPRLTTVMILGHNCFDVLFDRSLSV